jgi:hypothetical protein
MTLSLYPHFGLQSYLSKRLSHLRNLAADSQVLQVATPAECPDLTFVLAGLVLCMTLFSYPHFRLQSDLSKGLPYLRNSGPGGQIRRLRSQAARFSELPKECTG